MDISDVQRQIGLRLKELRLAKGLRQEDLRGGIFRIVIMVSLSVASLIQHYAP